MKLYLQTISQSLFEKAKKVIPGCQVCPEGGMYGHYSVSVSARNNPIYFSRSEGAKFWDVDGNEYIDYMCAYGPMILGYNHPVVDAAAMAQYKKGSSLKCMGNLIQDMIGIRHQNMKEVKTDHYERYGTVSVGIGFDVAMACGVV